MNESELTSVDALRLRQMAEQLNNVADVIEHKKPAPLKSGRVHELKAHPEPYAAMLSGAKTFEFRKDDRGFEVGDVLVIKEWAPSTAPSWQGYTGKETLREVTYILRGPKFDMPDGYVCMGIREVLAALVREKLSAHATHGRTPVASSGAPASL